MFSCIIHSPHIYFHVDVESEEGNRGMISARLFLGVCWNREPDLACGLWIVVHSFTNASFDMYDVLCNLGSLTGWHRGGSKIKMRHQYASCYINVYFIHQLFSP